MAAPTPDSAIAIASVTQKIGVATLIMVDFTTVEASDTTATIVDAATFIPLLRQVEDTNTTTTHTTLEDGFEFLSFNEPCQKEAEIMVAPIPNSSIPITSVLQKEGVST
jgi:hypothetical protein